MSYIHTITKRALRKKKIFSKRMEGLDKPLDDIINARKENQGRNANKKKVFEKSSRVFVGNLPFKTNWQGLKDHMNNNNNIVYCDIIREGTKSKGCGLVEYETVEDAQEAVDTLNNSTLEGRELYVRFDIQPNSGSIASKTSSVVFKRRKTNFGDAKTSVFVGNLPFDTKWTELKDICKPYAKTGGLHAEVFRGYGIVSFDSPKDAKLAIDELNEATYDDRVLNVRYDKEQK